MRIHETYKIAKTAGFTLLELMVALTILGITATQSYPRWHSWLLQHEARLAMRRIQQIIDYARMHAISGVEKIHIIPHQNDTQPNNWNHEVEICTANGNLIKTFPQLKLRGILSWHGSLACANIVFKDDGSCSCQGHFDYLSNRENNNTSQYAKRLTLLISGQTYSANPY